MTRASLSLCITFVPKLVIMIPLLTFLLTFISINKTIQVETVGWLTTLFIQLPCFSNYQFPLQLAVIVDLKSIWNDKSVVWRQTKQIKEWKAFILTVSQMANAALSTTGKHYWKLQHVMLNSRKKYVMTKQESSRPREEPLAQWYMWHLSFWGYRCQC